MRRISTWISLLLLIASTHAYGASAGPGETLLLEVSINGRTTQLVGQFTKRDDGLFATAAELRSLGINIKGKDDEVIAVSGFATRIQLDQSTLKIDMDVPMTFLNTTNIRTPGSVADKVPLAPVSHGALINYDLLASETGGVHNVGGYFDTRYFSGNGVLSTSGLGYVGGSPATSARLDSTYTYSNPGEMMRYHTGDFITSSLSWTRSVRFGGFQFGNDFTLRPDLIKTPTPSLGGEVVVPSTVDLYVNGMRQLSQAVQPGPFAINQTPIANGAGQISIAVTDELGRQTYRTVSFYATDKLLAESLSTYTLESGWVRRNYGISSANYGEFATAGSGRFGYSKTLTLETHAEAMRSMQMGGIGSVYNLGNWAVLTAAISGSRSDAGNGQQYSIGIERNSNALSASLTRTQATANYRDIGAIEGSPVSRATTVGTLGVNLGSYGSISLAYAAAKSTLLVDTNGTTSISDSRSVTLSYFKSLTRTTNMYITGYRDFRGGGYGATIGLILPFGGNNVGGVSAGTSNGQRVTSVQTSRPTTSPGDVGWQVQDNEGGTTQRYAEVDYKGNSGRASYTVAQSGSTVSQRAGVRGAIAIMDDSAFLSNWIDDSFAVVNTDGIKDVGIYNENRYAGKTNSDGQLLLTDLRSYDVNKVSVDVLDLPLTQQLDINEQYVKPRDRSGTVINFKSKHTSDASITLKLPNGNYVPIGSRVKIRENGQQAPVGYDGATYLSDLEPSTNTLDVVLPSGATCTATLTVEKNTDGGMSSNTLECH